MLRLIRTCRIAAWSTRIGRPQKARKLTLQANPACPGPVVLDRIARDARVQLQAGSPLGVGMALAGVGGWKALEGLRGPSVWGDQLERGREEAEEGPCEEERRIVCPAGSQR